MEKWKINKYCANCNSKIIDFFFACDVALCSHKCAHHYARYILSKCGSAPELWPTHKNEG